MISVLEKIDANLSKSEESDWSSDTPNEVRETLQKSIHSLATEGVCDELGLKVLFAPTGAVQEISMANEWGDEYLDLSKSFDSLIEKI